MTISCSYCQIIYNIEVVIVSEKGIFIDEEGNFTVNGTQLREEYVQEKALGECNITMPYTVPQGRVFVVGDNRVDSVDSRNNTIGSIEKEQIIGKLLVRVWPFAEFGLVK